MLIIFQFGVLIFSVVIHEVAHGLMALRLGDPTAKDEGRLTLNPVKHIDPIGSIILPILTFLVPPHIMLGWAKPVPYNPFLLYKDPKYGPLKVALAGPFSNLVIAMIFGLVLRFGGEYLPAASLPLFAIIVFLNCVLFAFNMIPIPPFDGSKVLITFLPYQYARKLESLGMGGIIVIFLFLYLFPGFVSGMASSVFKLIVGLPFDLYLSSLL